VQVSLILQETTASISRFRKHESRIATEE